MSGLYVLQTLTHFLRSYFFKLVVTNKSSNDQPDDYVPFRGVEEELKADVTGELRRENFSCISWFTMSLDKFGI